MKKECNVVMLATDKNESNIFLKDEELYFDKYGKISNKFIAQHLYITSDEEIKEDDWYLYWVFDKWEIMKCQDKKEADICNNHFMIKDLCFKIIATTDTSLKIQINNPQKALNRIFNPLSQIPQSFINTFIKEYNKGNVIDKVMVEHERYFRKANTGIPPKESLVSFPDEFELQINPDNTINISLIEKNLK